VEDFSALASRIAVSVGDIRGCVILSRDGLVLGSYPSGDDEAIVKPAWLRFAGVGDPERGFVQFGDEIWVYVRRGPYAGFAVSGPSARPGLIMDQIEQALLTAEETRAKREALKVPEAPAAPSGKPRTSLHREAPRPGEPVSAPRRPESAATEAPAPPPPPVPAEPVASGAPSRAPAAPEPQPPRATRAGGEGPETSEDAGEVDRVLLAQEFSRLLQDDSFDDEA
jgi:hypothetical protein